VVAIPLGGNTNTLPVVTPAAATTVIAVQDGREVARAQVKDAGAVLKVAAPWSWGNPAGTATDRLAAHPKWT
jgi:hypothetical protein